MIYRSLAEVPEDFGPCAISIGNFDGVHVVKIARAEGWKAAALTFDPHPTKLVAPERAPRLLTTLDQRARLMLEQGIDQTLVLPFTPDVARLSPEEFVRDILVNKLKTRAALVGANFHFGHKAAGNAETLEELGEQFSFETEIVQPVVRRGRIVSSSEIRRLIWSGNVSQACRMLGRPYALEGAVVRGHGIGSKQTVPTLNLETTAEVLPKIGVYVTRTRDRNSSREWPSITNVGKRPTFNGHELSVETYLLSPLDGPAPEQIAVEFRLWVRDERKFESPEALKSQILRDVGRAQAYFRRLSKTPAPAR